MASTETAPHDVETALQFAKDDKRRMLHVVYRVGDLDKTIESGILATLLFIIFAFILMHDFNTLLGWQSFGIIPLG